MSDPKPNDSENIFSRFFSGLLGKKSLTSNGSRISQQALDEAIENVVEGTEPKIRFLPSYKKTLKQPVIRSLEYIDQLVDSIPGPVPVSSATFSNDPRVHAYFASTNDIKNIFNDSNELQEYFKSLSHMDEEQAYALLCMNIDEKTVLGMELQDDMLRRDVLQTAVNFSEHKIMSPASSEYEVRQGIKQCIFDGLITNALQKLLEIKTRYQGLQEQQCILQSRLRSRQSQGTGLTRLISNASSMDPQCEIILEEMATTEEKLRSMPSQWEMPRHYLAKISEILDTPETFIRLEKVYANLNSMGIKVSETSGQDADCLEFDLLTIADVLKRVVAIVSYPRQEIQEVEKLF